MTYGANRVIILLQIITIKTNKMGNKIGQTGVGIQPRLTNKRTVILDYVRQQDGHLSAENVYKAVKK